CAPDRGRRAPDAEGTAGNAARAERREDSPARRLRLVPACRARDVRPDRPRPSRPRAVRGGPRAAADDRGRSARLIPRGGLATKTLDVPSPQRAAITNASPA